MVRSHKDMHQVVCTFERSAAKFIGSTRYNYGFVSEEEVDGKVRMTFLTCYLTGISRWLLMFGKEVEIESPENLRGMLYDLVEELSAHYKTSIEVS